jgi:hypothetical protein
MDIKKIENIKEIIAYNNNSALKRGVLSPSWVVGAATGWLCSVLLQRSEENKATDPAKKVDANYGFGYVSAAELGLNVFFAESVAATVVVNCNTAYFCGGFAADAFGLGTGKFMGAMRVGYKHGWLGLNDLEKPKPAEPAL